MKIEEIECFLIDTDGVPHPACIVRIRTDTGLTGVGQTACWGYPTAVEQIIDKF